MTMYFMQKPLATHQQILKACYSLAIPIVILLLLCCGCLGSSSGSGGSSGNSVSQQLANVLNSEQQPLAPGGPRRRPPAAADGAAHASEPDAEGNQTASKQRHLHHQPTSTNTDINNNNNNNNNISNNDNRIKLNASNVNGAKLSLLDEQQGTRGGEAKELPAQSGPKAAKPLAGDKVAPDGNEEPEPKPKQRDEDRDERVRKETLHKLMSVKDLRRTFQVETHEQVPEYQVLQLTVSQDGSHLISPISDLGELLSTATTTTTTNNKQRHHHPHRTLSGGQVDDDERTGAVAGGAQRDRKDSYFRPAARAEHASGEAQAQQEASSASNQKTSADDHGRLAERRVKRSAAAAAARGAKGESPAAAGAQQEEADKLIVMNLSTFGRDFSLRLKRNADFQQRIKDMKMFLAESTGDGKLRYTEIKQAAGNHHHHQPQQQQQHSTTAAPTTPANHNHKQEPHKRAADEALAADSSSHGSLKKPADGANDEHSTTASATTTTASSGQQAPMTKGSPATDDHRASDKERQQQRQASESANNEQRPAGKAAPRDGQPQNQHDWSGIGATYHDEDNLAALLIHHDRLTGQIRIDGTIGNDFVIKPVPRATLEALAAASAATAKPLAAVGRSGGPDLERAPSSASGSAPVSVSSAGSAAAPAPAPVRPANAASLTGSELREAAAHLHDDDPHDDDEMFLDEDEALEMANARSNELAPVLNQTTAASATSGAAAGATRSSSKLASERKWRKYRKMMAASAGAESPPSAAAEGQRARRQAGDSRPAAMRSASSHHIVYRLQPSSEASSTAHKHSFMLAPGQQSMEAMARRFPQGATSADDNDGDELDARASRLSRRHAVLDWRSAGADFEQDPMGGQFYLEPGSLTGFARAGHDDWSLVSGGRSLAAPPPYAFNSSTAGNATTNWARAGGSSGPNEEGEEDEVYDGTNNEGAIAGRNRTAQLASGCTRFKRHASRAAHKHPARPAGANRRHKRQAPDVVWPEVLLVVDYDSFLLHGGDSREVKRYFVSFWNGVDLRYKLLVNPHIRISLAGMIVAKDRDATPYLERNRLRAPNADAVDAAGALTDMGKYLYREDRLPTYDLAVVITKLDMCRRRYEGGRCNRGTAGFAYVGGACVVNKRLEKVNSVAIIEDSGGFSGIIVAAHEVGHLLGCVHDGSPPPSYLGGPGATHCPWEDGFIMSDLRHTERGFRWSQCSVEQFKHFLNGETATCLYNYPHESQMLHRLLPGSMLSLDDQCKRDRGTNACFKDARVCAQLFCFDSASGYCVSYRPAAEGSPCGDGHVCRNGKCVGEIENIIPDYTHQSQTVVAAAGRSRPAPAALVASGGSALLAQPQRLADNGLSASSTSTATSSPESNGNGASSAKIASLSSGGSTVAVASTASAGHSVQPQVSSRRMDTFAMDAPASAISSSNAGQQQQYTFAAPAADYHHQQSHLYHNQPHHHHNNNNNHHHNHNHHQSLPLNYHEQSANLNHLSSHQQHQLGGHSQARHAAGKQLQQLRQAMPTSSHASYKAQYLSATTSQPAKSAKLTAAIQPAQVASHWHQPAQASSPLSSAPIALTTSSLTALGHPATVGYHGGLHQQSRSSAASGELYVASSAPISQTRTSNSPMVQANNNSNSMRRYKHQRESNKHQHHSQNRASGISPAASQAALTSTSQQQTTAQSRRVRATTNGPVAAS